jgi:hypothetical protein
MLSQSLHHQYTPNPHFQPLPSSNGDLDPGSGMSHQQSMPTSSHRSVKARQHPYGIHADGSGRINRHGQMNGSTPGPIRRRISRACDQCNQLRTKCDGKHPCQHCIGQLFFSGEDVERTGLLRLIAGDLDFALKCEYARERKKRGKASRKDLQAAAAAAAAAAASGMSTGSASPTGSMGGLSAGGRRDSDLPPPPRPGSMRKHSSSVASSRTSLGELHDLSQQQMHHHHLAQHPHHQHHLSTSDSPSLQLNSEVSGLPLHFDRMSPFSQHSSSVPVSCCPFGMEFYNISNTW